MSEDPIVQHDDEKDCTDQLLECTSECDINDTECKTDCVEEYHECDISQEFTPEDVEQCITDGNDYKDCVDHMVATMPSAMTTEEDKFMHMDRGELVSECLQIAALLNGTCERVQTLNSMGRSSKKIIIEYDIKERDQRASQET